MSIKDSSTNVVVIGHTEPHYSRMVWIQELTSVLAKIADKVVVIGANQPADRENIEWIELVSRETGSKTLQYIDFIQKQIHGFNIARNHEIDFGYVFLRHKAFVLSAALFRSTNYQTYLIVTQRTRSGLVNALTNVNFRVSQNIVIESPGVLDSWNAGKYSGKTHVGGRFVEEDIFRKTEPFEGRNPHIGFIGILDDRKGVDILINSIEKIEESSSIAFEIAGKGPLENSVERLAEKRSDVTFHGFIPNDETPTFYNSLKLLVLPTQSEGLPAVVLESMACGTPVLATPVGGIPDVITEGQTGALLHERDSESLARRMQNLMNQKNLNQLSQSACELIESDYRFDSMVRRYEEILCLS